MKLGMVATYNIQNPLSWSGTPYSLYLALRECFDGDIETISLNSFHTDFNEKMAWLKNTDIIASIKLKERVCSAGVSETNTLNSKLLNKYCKNHSFDALLEFGGYHKGKNLPPYFIYSDATHYMSLDHYKKTGSLPYGYCDNQLDNVKRSAEFVEKIYEKSAGIFCMSDWMSRSIAEYTDTQSSKIHTVYAAPNWHGVDTSGIFIPKERKKSRIVNIVIVGVTYIGKGVDVLVNALEYLNNNSDTEYFLHVAGIREKHNELIDNPHIINYGFINKESLCKLLKKCDIFVLPSRFDCFGIAFLEAMSFGLPCIGRNICAMPEFITPSVNGDLIDSDDAKVLAEKIEYICSDFDRYKLYSANAVNVAKKFSWTNIANSISSIMCN